MIFTGSIVSDETVPLAAGQLQLSVLEQLRPVERHGEVVDLDIPGHGVDAQDAGAGSGLGRKTGLLLQTTAKFL